MSDGMFQSERENLGTHVDLCATRYRGVEKRLGRVELILWAIVFLLLVGEGTLADLVKRLFGVP